MTETDSKPGDINRNSQRLVAKTKRPGNDHNQLVWILCCERVDYHGEVCGHRYGASGSDYVQRKCPECQGGEPGLSIASL
ncbi:MAG: hypothetical protein ACKVP4_02220 [Hyphomicrobium sp.]